MSTQTLDAGSLSKVSVNGISCPAKIVPGSRMNLVASIILNPSESCVLSKVPHNFAGRREVREREGRLIGSGLGHCGGIGCGVAEERKK